MAPVVQLKCRECKRNLKKGKTRHRGESLWGKLMLRCSPDGEPYEKGDYFCDKCRHLISPSGKTLELQRKREARATENLLNIPESTLEIPATHDEEHFYDDAHSSHAGMSEEGMQWELDSDNIMEIESQSVISNVEATYSNSESSSMNMLGTCQQQLKLTTDSKKSVARPNSSKIHIESIRSVAYSEKRCCVCKDDAPKSRSAIPQAVRENFWMDARIWLPSKNRCCPHHHDKVRFHDEAHETLFSGAIKQQAELTQDELNRWIQALTGRGQTSQIDVDGNSLTDSDYHLLFGINKEGFDDLLSSIVDHLHVSLHRTPRTSLAIFLTKLRLGVSQRMLGFLYGLPQRKISLILARVSFLLSEHFVPKNLGYFHKDRQGFLTDNSSEFVRKLYSMQPENLILVLDGTYLYTEKSTNHSLQKKTFSVQKGRNLLKVMVVVTATGYIVDVVGVYFSDGSHNDAKILHDMFQETVVNPVSGNVEANEKFIGKLVKPGDLFVLDRGFRDIIDFLHGQGIKTLMPNLMPRNQRQFTTLEANQSRLVTLTRWVVEAVNGRLKNMFQFFDHVIPHHYFNENCDKRLNSYLRISCAIMNRYCPPIFEDREKHTQLLLQVENRKDEPNPLMEQILENRSDFVTKRNCWIEKAALDLEFPRLSNEELQDISLGVFNLKNAKGYTDEHLRVDHTYTVKLHKTRQNLLRIKLKSKYRNSSSYYQWIEYAADNEPKKIRGYYCECMGGAKSLGCCSHIASILWYLGNKRHTPGGYSPNTFGEDILDIIARKVVNVQDLGDSDDEED